MCTTQPFPFVALRVPPLLLFLLRGLAFNPDANFGVALTRLLHISFFLIMLFFFYINQVCYLSCACTKWWELSLYWLHHTVQEGGEKEVFLFASPSKADAQRGCVSVSVGAPFASVNASIFPSQKKGFCFFL